MDMIAELIIYFKSDWYIYGLLILTIVDFLTGTISSVINRKTSSKVGYIGVLKKVLMYLSTVGVGVASLVLFKNTLALDFFILFFVTVEIISILENLTESGIKISPVVLEIFNKEREKYEESKSKQSD